MCSNHPTAQDSYKYEAEHLRLVAVLKLDGYLMKPTEFGPSLLILKRDVQNLEKGRPK